VTELAPALQRFREWMEFFECASEKLVSSYPRRVERILDKIEGGITAESLRKVMVEHSTNWYCDASAWRYFARWAMLETGVDLPADPGPKPHVAPEVVEAVKTLEAYMPGWDISKVTWCQGHHDAENAMWVFYGEADTKIAPEWAISVLRGMSECGPDDPIIRRPLLHRAREACR